MTKSTHNGEAQRVGHLWGIPWEVGCYLPSINFLTFRSWCFKGCAKTNARISSMNIFVSLVWFMDDGGKAQNTPKAAYINTSCLEFYYKKLKDVSFISFKRHEVYWALRSIFKKLALFIFNQYNFDIPASYLFRSAFERVSPTILDIPEMRYKIGGCIF
uniref:Uncharacterized protein n=1 Tax=Trebouxia arboricola TaxID=53268 RepID=C7B7E6_9CHLO|nr:hypothetical protein [Trebouxia arboricola]